MTTPTAPARNPWLVLCTLMLGLFMLSVSTTSLNTAIPAISNGLGATFDQLLWVMNIYSLVLAVLIITAGRLGDLYGPKRLFLAGLTLFMLGSVLCGLSQSPSQLIMFRLVQGSGAALMSPQSLSMISKIFPPERRGAAIGIWGAVAGGAVAAGPSLGGMIITFLGWRWIFLVNVPICLVAMVMAVILIPELGGGRKHQLDLLGSALASVGLFLITFGFIEGQAYHWGPVLGWLSIPVIIGAGVVVLGLFVLVERGRQDREPLLPFVILRDRNFSLMSTVTITLIGGVGSMLLLLSIYLQSVLGMSALTAGLVMAIAPTVSIAFSPVSGRLTDRFGGKYILVGGLAMFAAGLLHIVLVADVNSTWWDLLPGVTVVGIAMGITFAPPTTVAMYNIDPSMAGAASGALSTIRMFGATIGAALVGAILQARLAISLKDAAVEQAAGLDPALREPLLNGVDQATAAGLEIGKGQFGIAMPADLAENAATALRQAAENAFSSGLTSAVRFAFLLPAGLLVLSILLTLAVRSRPAAKPEPPEPVPADPEPATASK